MIPELANHPWQSTLFAGVTGLLTLVQQKNRAAVRHGLWVAASVKFLVPFSLLAIPGTQLEWWKAPVPEPRLGAVLQIRDPLEARTVAADRLMLLRAELPPAN